MTTTPNIVNVYPAPSAQGIPVGDQIRIEFDQEMDLDSLNEGTIVVTGPDEAPNFGPLDITPFDVPGHDDEDILSSPYFKGYVKGDITFAKMDMSGGIIEDHIVDETGDGTLWRTVAIFTPQKPLAPNVPYKVIIAGDEAPDDDFDTGVKTRTVFDHVFVPPTGLGEVGLGGMPLGATEVRGTAAVNFGGGYTGTQITGYTVEITVEGKTGTAQYIWWNQNDPLTTYQGITTTGVRELEKGVYIECAHDGVFLEGDTFTVVVVPAEVMPNNYEWDFTTGSGNILTPPSDSSTTGLKTLNSNIVGSGVQFSSSSFGVTKVTPADGTYGVPISEDPYQGEIITVEFSSAVDLDTLAGDAIKLHSEIAGGCPEKFTAQGDLYFLATLESENKLVVTLDPGQLYLNNIIILELDNSISDIEGNQLVRDFTSYFTTPYSPLYSTIRRIQLDLGSIVSDVPDETIMLAILEASIQADALTYNNIKNTENFKYARCQYVTCLAESILVRAILTGVGNERMIKELGDLKVQRGGNNADLNNTLNQLEDCILTWFPIIQSGGELGPYTSVKPQVSVKGTWAEDAIVVGRQWEPTSGIGVNRGSAGNDNRYASGRRDLKTFRSRNGRRGNG